MLIYGYCMLLGNTKTICKLKFPGISPIFLEMITFNILGWPALYLGYVLFIIKD